MRLEVLARTANVGIEEGLLFHMGVHLAASFRVEVIPRKVLLEDFKRLCRSVGHLEERAICLLYTSRCV